MADYRNRVRRLMEKAQSATELGNVEEAQTYAEKAAELATKHGIEDALTEAFTTDDKPNIIHKRVTVSNPYPKHRITLIGVIAKQFSCKVIKAGRNGAELFGDERDVERVMFLYRLISVHMLDAAAKAHPEVSEAERFDGPGAKHSYFKKAGFTPAEVKSYRVSFVVGYVSGISSRMAEAYRATVAEAKTTKPGAAIVLADRKALAERLLKDTYPKLGKAAGSTIKHAGAFQRGRAASTTADLGQDRVGAGRRELSA